MKPVDIDRLFQLYIAQKLKEGVKPEQLEDEIPDLYLEWLEQPNEMLEGKSPGHLFDGWSGERLVEMLVAYISAGTGVPDPLLDALADAPDSEGPLYGLLTGKRGSFPDTDAMLKARRYSAELLNQRGSRLPLADYLGIIAAGEGESPLFEAAAQGLAGMGEEIREDLLSALKGADGEAADCLLDLLAALEHDPRVFDALVRHFRGRYERRAFFAGLLARYGDEAAIPVLEEALESVGYADYCVLRDAIESLGGTVEGQPDFSGDSDYEKMKLL